MKDVLKALDRNEDVDILYHGKSKGVLMARVTRAGARVEEHPFFNMRRSTEPLEAEMDRLRRGRDGDEQHDN